MRREVCTPSPARNRMKATPRALGAIMFAFVATAAVAQAPVRVEAVSTRAIVERVDVTGTVTSPRTAVLSTAVAGLVADIAVDEGRRVDAGDALLSLDAELAELALERVGRRGAPARNRAGRCEASSRRGRTVGPERGVARTQIESLRAEVAREEAALAACAHCSARTGGHCRASPAHSAVCRRHQRTLYGTRRVGESGRRAARTRRDGQPAFRLPRVAGLFRTIATDTPVEITLDSLPGETAVRARSTRSCQSRIPARGPFWCACLPTPANRSASLAISPGMSASAAFSLDTGRTGIAVSRDAILRFPDGRVTVWIVESRDGVTVVRERIVRTGLEFDGYVEVSAGLAEGDRVVTRGNESLQEGQAVKILDGGS